MTALHRAAVNDHHEAIRLLLINGADINGTNNDGRSALKIAVCANNPSSVSRLTQWGRLTRLGHSESIELTILAALTAGAQTLRALSAVVEIFEVEHVHRKAIAEQALELAKARVFERLKKRKRRKTRN